MKSTKTRAKKFTIHIDGIVSEYTLKDVKSG